MSLIIGYWPIRGLAESIYLTLEYLEIPYEKKAYTRENYLEWFENDKLNLGIDFPNLPYLIDGDFKTSQSLAILKYIGRKHGLFGGESNEEITKQEALLDSIYDLRMRFARLCYSDDFENKKKEYLENLAKNLKFYDDWLAKRKYMNGDKLFVGDFFLWSVLDINDLMSPGILEPFPNVARFKNEIASLAAIEKYLKSERFKKFPVNGFTAKWGGKEEA